MKFSSNINEVITLFLASYTINHPSFDQEILNPNARILDISTNYSYVEKKQTIFINLNFSYLVKNVV